MRARKWDGRAPSTAQARIPSTPRWTGSSCLAEFSTEGTETTTGGRRRIRVRLEARAAEARRARTSWTKGRAWRWRVEGRSDAAAAVAGAGTGEDGEEGGGRSRELAGDDSSSCRGRMSSPRLPARGSRTTTTTRTGAAGSGSKGTDAGGLLSQICDGEREEKKTTYRDARRGGRQRYAFELNQTSARSISRVRFSRFRSENSHVVGSEMRVRRRASQIPLCSRVVQRRRWIVDGTVPRVVLERVEFAPGARSRRRRKLWWYNGLGQGRGGLRVVILVGAMHQV